MFSPSIVRRFARTGLAVVSLLVAIQIATAQAADPATITFRHPAAQVKVVLAALSKAVGKQYDAVPSLWNEYVIVDVKNAKLSDLLERIARVTDSEWHETSAGLILNHSPALVSATEKRERQERREAIAKKLEENAKGLSFDYGSEEAKKMLSEVQPEPDESTDYSVYLKNHLKIEKASPNNRLLVRMLYAIGPDAIASVDVGDRVTFSTRPNKMQLPIPNGTSLLRLYANELSAASAALDRYGVGPNRYEFGGWRRNPKSPLPVKVDVTVSNRAEMFGQGMTVRMTLLGPKPQMLGTSNLSLGAIDMESMSDFSKPDPNADPKESAFPLKLCPQSEAFMKVIKSATGFDGESPETGMRPMVRDTKEADLLRRPDLNEPLSMLVSDVLFSLADYHKANLVAAVPDDSALTLAALFEGQLAGIGPHMQVLRKVMSIPSKPVDGWIEARPKEHGVARLIRLDRLSLASVTNRDLDQDNKSSEVFAKFCASGSVNPQVNLLTVFCFIFSLRSAEFSFASDMSSWRLYGKLGPTQRTALWQGQRIPFGLLTPDQTRALRAFLVGDSAFEDAPSSPKECHL